MKHFSRREILQGFRQKQQQQQHNSAKYFDT